MTGAPWYWARSALRHRWRALLLPALLVAVACAVPTAAAAGARRTASVIERTHEQLRAADVELQDEEVTDARLAQLREMPGVEAVGLHSIIFLRPSGTDFHPFYEFFAVAPADQVWAYQMMRPRVDDGRLPAPDAAREVLVTRPVAEALDLEVGATFTVDTLAMETLFASFETGDIPAPDEAAVELEVVGIGVLPMELLAPSQLARGTILFSPAFLAAHPEVAAFTNQIDVRVAGGAEAVDDFVVRMHDALGRDVSVTFVDDELEQVRGAVDVQRTGLLLFLAVSALAAFVAIVQVALRTASRHGRELATLDALGLGTRQRIIAMLSLFVPAAVGGAFVGAVAAYPMSGLLPFGTAGRLEPDPGLHADWPVLVGGALVTVAVAFGGLALATVAVDRRRRPTYLRVRRPLVRNIGEGSATPVVLGARWAVSSPSRASTTRSALAGTVIAVAGIVGASIFAASLHRLMDTPSRYGITYDLHVGLGDGVVDDQALGAASALAARDDVAAVSFARVVKVPIGNDSHDALGIEKLKGDIGYSVIAGREPVADDEMVAGAYVLRDLDLDVGDWYRFDGGTYQIRVVGRATFPPLDDNNSVATAVGFTRAGLTALASDLGLDPTDGIPEALVDAADDVEVHALQESIRAQLGFTAIPTRPTPIDNLREADDVPLMLGLFLGVLGLLALAHTIAVSATRRRTDLAVLRCLGFDRAALAITPAAQTFTTVALGAAVGLPLGVLAGRSAWGAVASDLGVASDVTGVWRSLGLVLLGSLVVAGTAAGPWSRSAARLRPARTLRAE